MHYVGLIIETVPAYILTIATFLALMAIDTDPFK